MKSPDRCRPVPHQAQKTAPQDSIFGVSCYRRPTIGASPTTFHTVSLRGWVNKGLSSLLRRLAPEPRDPSCDGYGQPDGYELAYSVPCPNPHHHLPKEAPRVQDAPIHVELHVTPKWGVLPALQVRVPYKQH